MSDLKKLYCYVDETGQDAGSEIFIVVAVVSSEDQQRLRDALLQVETEARTGRRKWHKSNQPQRIKYITTVLQKNIAAGDVYFERFKKPIPYFFPTLETIERAIVSHSNTNYKAVVFVDGIDQKKAAELTNALRARGIRLNFVRSRRDESEPVIRLADMWAGCIRGALKGNQQAKALFEKAKRSQYLIEVTKQQQSP